MKKVICGLSMLLGLAVHGVAGATADDLKSFPAAQAGQQAGLLRYNPEIPVVMFVPEGVELRYRVWRAAPDIGTAKRE